MKNLSVLFAAFLATGCATSITTPQDITESSEIDRRYALNNHHLGTPTIEMRSLFDVNTVELDDDGQLILTGKFHVSNKTYVTDSRAVAVFDIDLENLGDDRVMITKLTAKDFNLFSVHKPVESTINNVFMDMTRMLSHELEGEIVTGQVRLAIGNKVNELVKW